MLLHLLFVALGAAVPFYGVLALGWSIATLTILISIECLVSFGPMCLRILRHERLTQDPRHRQRSVYGRFGKWIMPASYGRFVADYALRGVVGALALVGASCMMPLIYRKEFPELAHLMQVDWQGVAWGAAAIAGVAAMESAVQWRLWGREPFPDLHRTAGVPFLLMIGLILGTLFSPLLVDWIRQPLVLLLAVVGIKTWLAAARGAPRD
jgi:hypothetical protein